MKPDLVYYGDDFTGSTDALEVLAAAGLDPVLFFRVPSEKTFQRFAGRRAIGLAGASRSQSPQWMDVHLEQAFQWLKSLGARICHYKVCSTFDSAPGIGNIGRAMEIGRRVFATPYVPILVGAPALGRYVVFGNLFAAVAGGGTARIDRHPVMSCHPVTPMREGDLRLHLAPQTAMDVQLLDLLALRGESPETRLSAFVRAGADAVLFDTLDRDSLSVAGRLLWEHGPAFVAGSSGVEYALAAHWGGSHAAPRPAAAVDRIAVLSGSCSAVTGRQIGWALANGFGGVALDPAGANYSAVEAACAVLAEGRSVLLYSAIGSENRRELDEKGRQALAETGGQILFEVIRRTKVGRVVIAGGDTSSHAAPRLGLAGLTFAAPLAPGAPLCKAFGENDGAGIEIVCKGGQCGSEAFFGDVVRGKVL